MRAGCCLVALLAIAGAGCSLDVSQKNGCVTNSDCFRGQSCVNLLCQRWVAGPADAARGKQDASSDHQDGAADHQDASSDRQDSAADSQDSAADHQDSAADSGRDASNRDGDASAPPILATCDAGTVTACSAPAAPGQCPQIYCGGRLWRTDPQSTGATIPYRIRDPNGLFSDAYKAAIRSGATTWSRATGGMITFIECSSCTGRFVSVVPGAGDGVDESQASEQLMPLPVDPTAPGDIPWHRIAHQWGHAIGLDDMYRRPDRDRYASFDPGLWCGRGDSLPATCASSAPTQQPGSPPLATGTFGPYDELSVMNGLPGEGVCGDAAPDPSAGQPTLGDVSAVEELYFSSIGPWSRFQPIARSTGAHGPPDYQLAPGVDPVDSPAIAEWTTPSVDIAVRGSDGNVYETWNDLLGTTFVDWADWRVIADHVDADPALVFVNPTTLHLVVRSALDGSIRLRTRTTGVWGPWGSLGAPSVGAASAPTIASRDGGATLTVLVRGGDGLIYAFECADPVTRCAARAAAAQAWTPLPPPDHFDGFVGKPVAALMPDGSGILYVSAVGLDHQGWLIGSTPDWGGWIPIAISVSADDPDPSVAVASLRPLDYFVRDANGLLVHLHDATIPLEIGGMPITTPSAAGSTVGDHRVDLAAVIDDHGHPGVWWKFLSPQTTPPCNYNAPGTCAQCGCGFTGGLPCDL
jgi:hypothetical protein